MSTSTIFIISPNVSSRERFLVMHFTATSNSKGVVQHFSQSSSQASSHYLVGEYNGEADEDAIYQFASEKDATWHAGISAFGGYTNINGSSIGIEHTNLGFVYKNDSRNRPGINGVIVPGSEGMTVYGSGDKNYNSTLERDVKFFYFFTNAQVMASIKLSSEIIKRNQILPYRVISHAEIAISAGRKTDPGPLFPWKIFAENGVGLWYNTKLKYKTNYLPSDTILSDQSKRTDWCVETLVKYGYQRPTMYKASGTTEYITSSQDSGYKERLANFAANFKMHYNSTDSEDTKGEVKISKVFSKYDAEIINSLICLKEWVDANTTLKNKFFARDDAFISELSTLYGNDINAAQAVYNKYKI